MSTLFIFEFEEDFIYLRNLLKKDKELIIVTTNHITTGLLKNNKIKFVELVNFYNSKKKYKDHLKEVLEIPKLLEKSLFNNYREFAEKKWNIFEDFFYPIKICYDQTCFYTNCLDKLINKYKPDIIHIRHEYKLNFSAEFLFRQNQSVLYHILINQKKRFKIKVFNKTFIYKKIKNYFINFNKIKSKIRYYLLEKFKFQYRLNYKIDNIISLGSYEVDTMLKNYPNLKKNIIHLRHQDNKFTKKESKIENQNFINELKNNSYIKKKFFINSFDVTKIFINQISEITSTFKDVDDKFNYFSNLIKKENTKLIIFLTMAPFNNQNIVFNKICDVKKIKKVTWTHGGYCSVNLPGYDVTDFKSCQNHFSYGSYLKEIINDKKFLPSKVYENKFQSYSIGSALINKNFIPPKKKKNKLKKIIFIRGLLRTYNSFYFPIGKNKEQIKHRADCSYDLNVKILNVLKKYQYDYEIVFKLYPYPVDEVGLGKIGSFRADLDYWKKFLIDNGMSNIKIISNEKPLPELFDNNQLVILPWLSTTFFQALPYNNEIFLYDDASYNRFFKTKDNEINFFDNKKKFLTSLKIFLPKFKYTKIKNNSNAKKYFLNENKINNIKKNFDSAINDILKNDIL